MKNLFKCAILGPPASGKGTISTKITTTFEICHISTGDMMRQNIADKTPIGNTIKKYLADGKLVPDELVLDMVFDRLKQITDRNWLCDGFPRTLKQAQELHKVYPFTLVLNLDVPYDVIIRRIQGRWIHVSSGRSYNTEFKPPKKPGIDDETGEPLVQRPDDNLDSVKNRLEAYDKLKDSLLQFYESKGILKVFKDEGQGADIWPPVKKTLEQYMKPKS